MAAEDLLKDVGEIHGRLLDHRPLLQGELSFVFKEFEEKRNFRECQRLQKSVEYARELSEQMITESKEVAEKNLPPVTSSVGQALEMCNSILDQQEHNTAGEAWLVSQREARVKEWSDFMDSMCTQSTAVDSQHQQQIDTLEKYYEELETKLNLTPSPS